MGERRLSSFPLWQQKPLENCVESSAEDDPSEPVVGVSATAVWTSVVKQVSTTRMDEGGKKTFANVSGRFCKVPSPVIVASRRLQTGLMGILSGWRLSSSSTVSDQTGHMSCTDVLI
jgi:hypothetical protein